MKATSKTKPYPGLGIAELVGIMFDHYRQEVTLDSVKTATDAGLRFVEVLKKLCELSGLNPRDVGVLDAIACVDRLLVLRQKLEATV